MSPQNLTDLSELIAEEFGANATYVQGLLERFRSNPELVDDSWRAYFSELLGDATTASQSSGNGQKAATVKAEGDGARTNSKELPQFRRRNQTYSSPP